VQLKRQTRILILRIIIMAIILPSLLVNGISGSIGSTNYYNFKGRIVARQKGFSPKSFSAKTLIIKSIHSKIKKEYQTGTIPGGKEIYEEWGRSFSREKKRGSSSFSGLEYAIKWRSIALFYDITNAGPAGLPSGSIGLPIINIFEYAPVENFGFFLDWNENQNDYLIVNFTDTFFTQAKVPPKKFQHNFVTSWSDADRYKSVLHLKLDDHNPDNSIKDSSGQDQYCVLSDGTPNPTARDHSVEGKIKSALEFDGINDKITVSDDSDLLFTAGFTFSSWLFLRSAPANSASIAAKVQPGAGPGNGFEIYVMNSRFFRFYILNNSTYFYGYSNTRLELDEWTHVAISFGLSGNYKTYINGTVTKTANAGLFPGDSSGAPLVIGKGYDSGEYLDAILDDFRFCDKALSEKFIAAIYNNGIGQQKKKFMCYDLDIKTYPGVNSFWLSAKMFSTEGGVSAPYFYQYQKKFIGN